MHKTNIEKFKNNRPLLNKRYAWNPVCDMLEKNISSVGSKRFMSFGLTSATLWDIEFLRKNGVPDENYCAAEIDRKSYDAIKTQSQAIVTDFPLELGQRLWAEDGKYFDWFNFDLCGPANGKMVQFMLSQSKKGIKEGSIVTITLKCSRESSRSKNIMDTICELTEGSKNIPLQEKREIFLRYVMTVLPIKCGWFPAKCITVKYKEDRYKGEFHSNGGTMMCCAVQYTADTKKARS